MNINKFQQISISFNKFLRISIIIILFLGILLFISQKNFSLPQPTTKAQSSYVSIGKGCTNAYYIDKDCDGYGVASPNGPDADDNDPEVNTPETVIAKYGNLTNFLHHLGYYPDRIFYIATNGNDSTGEVNNINKPYKTWDAVNSLLQPGDAVIFKGGIYNYLGNYAVGCSNLNGTADKPIIIMAYPGEKAIIDSTGSNISIANSSYLTFDGFVLDNTQSLWGNGISGHYFNHLTFRNIEAKRHASGMHCGQKLHNILIENCVIHDNPQSHGIYLNGDTVEKKAENIIVRNCLMYRNGRHGFQFNGIADNILCENNIIHSNALGGFSLLRGVRNSIFRNNLIFNNTRPGFIFFIYDCPYGDERSEDNNLIINNIVWEGKYENEMGGGTQEYKSAVVFNDSIGSFTFTNNTFRNNIFVTYSAETFYFNQHRHFPSTTIENNIFYKMGNHPNIVMTSDNGDYDFETFESMSSLVKNNLLADPKFTDVSIDYNLTPEKFNFDYLSDSPAKNHGTTTDAPSTDLRGNPRDEHPDAGCYEYGYLPQNLTILTSTLPQGIVNQSYTATLQATGGTSPYTWSKISGNLPNGLSLNSSTGIISGTPTTQGTFNFTIQVKDNENNTATKSLSITINQPDTTPPTRSNGSPTGELPAGTTQITLSLTTNENATCKYSTTPNIPYASMTNTFSNTGGTSHSTTITGLSSGNTYNYYIKCIDTSNNANTDDYTISFSIASPGEITTVVSKIKPDCTGESGLCFTSLAAWEEARQGDITASGRNTIEVAECYPMVDTTPVVIDGWKTDANHYIKIYTPETARHNGTAGTGYRLDITDGTYVIYIRESHVKIFGLELTGSGVYNGFYMAEYEDLDDIELAYNLIHDLEETDNESTGLRIAASAHYVSNLKFYNNIIYNIGGRGFWCRSSNASNSGNVFNNTIFKCNESNNIYGAGIRDDSGQLVFKNNAVFDSGNKDYYGNEATQNGGSNNASSDNTGSSGLQNLNSADQFVNTTDGSEDLHLKSGADLIDAGTDLSSYFTDDIDGQNRIGTWDIGADERIESTYLKGDLNQDNKVNSSDFQILIQKFKETQNIEIEDLNSDGIVDIKDIGILMHYWSE